MTKVCLILAAMAAGLGAALPPSSSYLVATAPVPPGSLSKKAAGFSSAPLPNVDLARPAHATAEGASLEPSLFSPKNNYHGDGYVWGSTVQTEQERKLRPAPGVNLSVPLQ